MMANQMSGNIKFQAGFGRRRWVASRPTMWCGGAVEVGRILVGCLHAGPCVEACKACSCASGGTTMQQRREEAVSSARRSRCCFDDRRWDETYCESIANETRSGHRGALCATDVASLVIADQVYRGTKTAQPSHWPTMIESIFRVLFTNQMVAQDALSALCTPTIWTRHGWTRNGIPCATSRASLGWQFCSPRWLQRGLAKLDVGLRRRRSN